jgi:hypothetical protein
MEWRWNEISSRGVHTQFQLHGVYSQTQEAGDVEQRRRTRGTEEGSFVARNVLEMLHTATVAFDHGATAGGARWWHSDANLLMQTKMEALHG